MITRFTGRGITQKPCCPFCGLVIDPPREPATRLPTEMPVGLCGCGAAYAYDATGHNLGTALIEALVAACGGDWDLAWGLLPEEDYQEGRVSHYDLEAHLVISGGAYQGRRIGGTLYFIRLVEDVREVTQEKAEQRLSQATAVRPAGPARGRKSFSKQDVEAWVAGYDLEPLLEAAAGDPRIIRDVQRLTYTADDLLRHRAAEALGRVAAVVAGYDPGAVVKLLQRLLTALSDTAASSWGALEAIGEVIRNRPAQFAGFVPQLFKFAADRPLLGEVLRALASIAEVAPDLLRQKAHRFVPLLEDPDPEIRGASALLLGRLGAAEARPGLQRLAADRACIPLYEHGLLESKPVGHLAARALDRL